jgi:hypothetical protein
MAQVSSIATREAATAVASSVGDEATTRQTIAEHRLDFPAARARRRHRLINYVRGHEAQEDPA